MKFDVSASNEPLPLLIREVFTLSFVVDATFVDFFDKFVGV